MCEKKDKIKEVERFEKAKKDLDKSIERGNRLCRALKSIFEFNIISADGTN